MRLRRKTGQSIAARFFVCKANLSLQNLNPFYFKATDPRIIHVMDCNALFNTDSRARIIYIAQFTFIHRISFFCHSFFTLVRKTYRHLLIRRRASAGDLLNIQHNMLPLYSGQIFFCAFIQLYHVFLTLSFRILLCFF